MKVGLWNAAPEGVLISPIGMPEGMARYESRLYHVVSEVYFGRKARLCGETRECKLASNETGDRD
jgi:hypothetical protein